MICSGKGCSNPLYSGAYRIDVTGKYTPTTKDAQEVTRVYHFCPEAQCFIHPKERSNTYIPTMKEDAVILVDPTIIMTTAEKVLLSAFNLNLLFIGNEK